ncbi:methyltransferase [Methylacidiphilum sp. Yel]|jgi:hypothetical protein|uniref:small ribosomal subunit Rsm22 family protein n=1 Tax=Methylacidiphilum sp. Yel TaxID=1847730 RepID=UPI00106C41CE|nr:small ribosomal subunit Rsm22 family protein [Methylacidiphilum sp. Yel]TFE70270.1 methyltransferase [Methylacidiphilum sp. Yel]
MGTGLTKYEKEILEKLRNIFLSQEKYTQPYWKSEAELSVYDKVFGERIRWKWQSVLRELSLLEWIPTKSHVIDWGCGSGIAARTFYGWALKNNFQLLSCFFWDYSSLAMRYAQAAFCREFSNIPTKELTLSQIPKPFILLLSHVIGELTEKYMDEMLTIAKKAEAILWVEPAKKEYSKKIIELREVLKEKFWMVAPCLHQQKCQMLDQEKNWCHFFASVPRYVFHSSFWSQIQNLLGIDLRSVAYSYLVMDSRKTKMEYGNLFRIIGTVRNYKAYSELLCCSAAGELQPKRYLHRYNPWLSKSIKKGAEISTLAKSNGENPPMCAPFEKSQNKSELIG